jgi:hypothetical protein
MKVKLVLIVLLLVSTAAFAVSLKDRNFGDVVVSEVVSIYDGDTLREA